MSYNYLPLDRKTLHFQQVKNLLDYKQLVSITFDAHERILKCREYIDTISPDNNNVESIAHTQYDLVKNSACATGAEAPADVVKLVVMLKIKSLSYGFSGVQIETVKRLMEMYNNEVFPVIYTQGATGASGASAALAHLALPLIGLGEVHFKGEKRSSSEVLAELGWLPLNLQRYEGLALVTGTQFITAYALYALKKAEQLIKFADVIAALSYAAIDCSLEALHPKIHSVSGNKGQVKTAAAILKYLQGSETSVQKKPGSPPPYSFTTTPQVHGASKDAFESVLAIFLKEINAVTENVNVFSDEQLVLSSASDEQPLSLALDFLAIAMNGLASISERRTFQLINGGRSLQTLQDDNEINRFKTLAPTATALVNENKLLCSPASVNSISFSSTEDFVSNGTYAATKSLEVINNIEKVLAIELLCVTRLAETRGTTESPIPLKQMVGDFRQQVAGAGDDLLHRDIIKATGFIRSYKL